MTVVTDATELTSGLVNLFQTQTGEAADASFGTYAMTDIGGDLFVGIGNQPAGSDGALVAKWDGALAAENVLDEQGVHDMHVNGSDLWVAGTDPTQDWTLGNVYKRDSLGVWSKIRTQPNTIHTLGMCHVGADLYVAVGAHAGDNVTWQGRVMKSSDSAATWPQNVQVNDYRMYDVIGFGARLYASGWDYQSGYINQLLWSDDGGATWNEVAGTRPHRRTRFMAWGTNLVTVNEDGARLIVVASDFSVTTPNLPTGIDFVYSFQHLAVAGAHLYVLDLNGYLWRTLDGIDYERYSYVNNAITIAYWANDNSIIIGDTGADAKLWRVGL